VLVIDGPIWFVAALVICGWHALYIWGWRRERREHAAWWQAYDARAQERHDDFMRALQTLQTDDGEERGFP